MNGIVLQAVERVEGVSLLEALRMVQLAGFADQARTDFLVAPAAFTDRTHRTSSETEIGSFRVESRESECHVSRCYADVVSREIGRTGSDEVTRN
jgi:hypothetical protein